MAPTRKPSSHPDAAGYIRRLEVEATSGPRGYSTVPLCGVELRVKPSKKWRASSIEHLGQDRYNDWARKCLHPDDVATWMEIDPTGEEIEEFFLAWRGETGQNTGE
jgi:hypothetical protein